MLEFPLTVLPLLGLEAARFGESRADHRSRFGEFESWQRDPDSPGMTDLYLSTLVSFDYDEHDRLVFIEVNNDEGALVCEGVPLLNRPLDEVLAALRAIGHEPMEPYGGVYAVPSLGIRLLTGYNPEVCDGSTVTFVGIVPEETRPQFRAP